MPPSDDDLIPPRVSLTREQWLVVRHLFRRRPELLKNADEPQEEVAA